MRTSKPISTISYNTEKWLKAKINDLVKGGIIEFGAFIKHQPEDDEAGKKEHFHVYIIPAKIIQTVDFALLFHQLVKGNKIPRKSLPFQCSKFGDWYLYGLHDSDYLAYKNQSRKYHYEHKNFWCSDRDYFQYLVKTIDMTKINPYQGMKDAQSTGLTFQEYFKRGCIPIQQIAGAMLAWDLLKDIPYQTFRNERQGHE